MSDVKESDVLQIEDLENAWLFCQKSDGSKLITRKYQVVPKVEMIDIFQDYVWDDYGVTEEVEFEFKNGEDDEDGYLLSFTTQSVLPADAGRTFRLVIEDDNEFAAFNLVGIVSRAYIDEDDNLENDDLFFVSKSVANENGIIDEVVIATDIPVQILRPVTEDYKDISIKIKPL